MGQSTPPDDTVPHPAERKAPTPGTSLEKSSTAVQVSKTNESSAVMQASRAAKEIEVMAIMAERNPRDIVVFRDRMISACTRIQFADAATWERPVGDKEPATGLSIRFAEECARNYRNLNISIGVVSEDDEQRVLEAVGVDLEVNVWHRVQTVVPKYVERLYPRKGDEVLGSRMNSRGEMTYRIRANDDAMFTNHQKAAAKAKREVILFFIPSEIKEECEELIERTLAAVEGDPEKFREKLVKAFAKVKVEERQLEGYLGKLLSQANILELRGLKRAFNAIDQGETTWADLMAAKRGTATEGTTTEPQAPVTGSRSDQLRQTVAKKAETVKAPVAATPTAPSSDSTDLQEDLELVRREGRGE